ncbi:MAG: tetratricopeptide repeat protein [Cyanobacteria bacterium P01_D01_bin.71]
MPNFSPSLMPPTAIAANAHTLLESGNYHQALQAFQNISDSDRTAEDWVNHAVCLIHLGRSEEALQICDCALLVDADYPTAWLFKGVALHRLRRFSEAYECYRKASHKSTPS